MFTYITKKLNRNVCFVVAAILTIYFLAIFFVYSLFLRNDFLEKSQNIGQKISNHLSIQCENIETLVKNCVQTTVPSSINYSEVTRLMNNCLASNININHAFFFDKATHYSHSNYTSNILDQYVINMQLQYDTLSNEGWDIFNPENPLGTFLLYRYKVTFQNGDTGYLVLVPDIDAYLRNADIYHNNFIHNATMFISNSQNEVFDLYIPDSSNINLKYATKPVTEHYLLKFTINYPLNESLYLQIHFSFHDVFISSLPMLYFFFVELLLVIGLCYWGIHRYTQFLNYTLTTLTQKLKHVAKTEKISREE